MSTSPHRLPPSDALAELARLSLGEHSVDSAMARVADVVRRVLPGASEVSVTLRDDGAVRTAAATGDLALALDERQYETGDGPCLQALASGAQVLVDSVPDEWRWPAYTSFARERGLGSSLSTPVPGPDDVLAAVNAYRAQVRAFDGAGAELLRALAAYAGVALGNLRLYDAQARAAQQLQAAMESRAVVEQAKGILMGLRHCTAEEAFEALVEMSQDAGRALRDVARDVVEQATGTRPDPA